MKNFLITDLQRQALLKHLAKMPYKKAAPLVAMIMAMPEVSFKTLEKPSVSELRSKDEKKEAQQ